MNSSVRKCLQSLGHEPVVDLRVDPIAGGSISHAMRVRWSGKNSSRHQLFLKCNSASFVVNFQCEFTGLGLLQESHTIGVPNPIAVALADGFAWLATQWIEQAKPAPDYFQRFGRDLAKLHRATRGDRVGLGQDNYLGASLQPNSPARDWIEFVADRRLGFQLRWAMDQGLVERPLRKRIERVIDRLPHLLEGRDPQTSLLHGDLWSGNYLSDVSGRPVIVDPAVYYGCPEAEWGMIRLFGACPPEFAESYHDEYPLADGWQRRASVYVLYHLLNHLNLFGRSYASQCQSTVDALLRD